MKRPFKCPVCGGTGTVVNGFYDTWVYASTSTAPETCRSCLGTGIVWNDGYIEQLNQNDTTG